MAGFWDVVGRAANLFQLVGLDATTIITLTTCFLGLRDITEECRKLEDSVQAFAVLLSQPGCWITQQQQNSEQLRHMVTSALDDARDLIDSYNDSTLFARVWRGRSTAARFRDLRRSVDTYCGLILSVNAFLLAVQASVHPPPPPLAGHCSRTPANDAGGVPPGDSTDAETTPAAATDDDHTHTPSSMLLARMNE